MKKFALLIVIAFCYSVSLTAQNAHEEMISIDKKSVPGFSVTFPDMTVEAVEAALIKKMEKQVGLKASKFSGYIAYLNQSVPDLGPLYYDIYAKVASVGKKDNQATVLYFFVSKGNLNPVTSASEPEVYNNIIKFLDNFVPYAKINDAQNLDIILNNQLNKMEKENKSLLSEQKKLQNKLEDLNKKIADNEALINKTKNDIENNQIQLKLMVK